MSFVLELVMRWTHFVYGFKFAVIGGDWQYCCPRWICDVEDKKKQIYLFIFREKNGNIFIE